MGDFALNPLFLALSLDFLLINLFYYFDISVNLLTVLRFSANLE